MRRVTAGIPGVPCGLIDLPVILGMTDDAIPQAASRWRLRLLLVRLDGRMQKRDNAEKSVNGLTFDNMKIKDVGHAKSIRRVRRLRAKPCLGLPCLRVQGKLAATP